MGRFNEFIDNVITQFYIETTNINQDDLTLYTKENTNYLATENPDIYKKILETEDKCQFENLENLGIDHGSEIFFETRKNIDYNPVGNQMLRCSMRENMILYNKFKEQGNIMIAFKTTLGDGPYVVTVNENETIDQAIFKLKKDYPIFKNAEILGAILNGDSLFREEKRFSTLKDLQIKESDNIVIQVQTIVQ